MKIQKIRTIFGPNIYHSKPVLVMTLDLESLRDTASTDHPWFIDDLLDLLPGLQLHRCSPGYEGGFVERLRRGTYFAHIVEHIALELSGLAGIDVGYGKSIYGGTDGVYTVVVRFKCEKGMTFLLRSAVEIAQNLVEQKPVDLTSLLTKAKDTIERYALGPSTRAIVDAAEAKNIPWMRLNDLNLIQFGYGKNRKFIQATTTSDTSDIGVDIAQDKELTKNLLTLGGIPVPTGSVVQTEEGALEVLTELRPPLVVKPDDGHQGQGATLRVMTAEDMQKAFALAKQFSNYVMIEEFATGNDYRVVVINDKMVAAARRVPAHVIGTGTSTISQLIDAENLNPERGEGHQKALTIIEIDDNLLSTLRRQHMDLATVPACGQTVFLRETANLSTGGTAHDVTDEVHPDIKMMCRRAARIIGLDICGIDLVAEDISKSPNEQSISIIEVNASPGIRMHHYPSTGRKRDVGRAIMDTMYEEGQDSRIPIVAITGTNGKTTVTRMIAEIVSTTGKTVGVTTSDGVYVDHVKVADGDTTGAISARNILCDPGVEVAVLETARGGIVRRGLGYDWSDVGVITNIQPDHIGQDGIKTLDDIVKIKSIVVERVRPGGTVVLNAEDPSLTSLADDLHLGDDRTVVYYSTNPNHPAFLKHCSHGGRGYTIRNGWIVETEGKAQQLIANISEVPLTYHGTAVFQVSNTLASVAAARGLGLDCFAIRSALPKFIPGKHNQGRVNLYKVRDSYFIVDYGHNPKAFEAIALMVRKWKVPLFTGVIAVPGDRDNHIIEMAGSIAAHAFDRVIVREDDDLRGREPGETAKLLCKTIGEENSNMSCRIVLNCIDAFRTVVQQLTPGEVVAFFYDDLHEIQTLLREHNATEVTDFTELTRYSLMGSSPEPQRQSLTS